MSIAPEKRVQAELYRHLKNAIDKGFKFQGIEFADVKVEEPRADGRPDLVIFAKEKGKEIPMLVIETKRKVPRFEVKFDPFSMEVIRQAEGYATFLGAPYFATCNGEILVLLETFRIGVPLPQRKLKDYKVTFDEKFAQLLLEEVARFRLGVGKWLELDEVFVDRLRYFHEFITPKIYSALTDKLRDKPFKDNYAEWLEDQLFEFSDETNKNITEQTAYLLMNKILFYKTLEAYRGLPKLQKIDVISGIEFSNKLREYFDKVLDINYRAIFERQIFDEIPLSDDLVSILNEFIEELDAYNLASIKSDVIGRVYEELIPSEERHRLGQYYTPPPIVELIVKMCIKNSSDRVLDPGCGSGGFLVKAYHKLKELKKEENPLKRDSDIHRELLDQIWGIDINQFPAHLSAINLAVQNLKVFSDNVHVVVSDFFNVIPTHPSLEEIGFKISLEKEVITLNGKRIAEMPSVFDVVVTNPPYTRQEEMSEKYKEEIRKVALNYFGESIDLDARAGIYAYFFTHSAKFLKNGGRMGYITSNTWLDVGFGEDLKSFFLEHFKIIAIIEHDAGVFGRAIVDTCIVILEKAEGKSFKHARNGNIVKFVRIKKSMNIDEILSLIEIIDQDYENGKIKVVLKKQGELKSEEKWGKYLRAPAIYFKIINHPKVIRLEEIARLKRAFTTGANEFFLLDKSKVKLWGIEREYLAPVISSPRDVKYIEFRLEDLNKWILMVHELKSKLKLKNVLKYIEHGEMVEIEVKRGSQRGKVKGYQNLRTIEGRKLWYDLGKVEPAPILFAKMYRGRYFVVWNNANAQAIDNFYNVYPNELKHQQVLLGILNSSAQALMVELHGRLPGRGLLELMVFEVEDMPVLNPPKLTEAERSKIKDAFLKLCEVQRKSDKKAEDEAREELDNAVFDALDLTKNERKQVYEGLEYLRKMRRERKQVGMLVEAKEAWKPLKRLKRKELEKGEAPFKRLDLWV